MTEKSEHTIRREHFVAGWESGEEAERARIIALLQDNTCPTCEGGDIVHTGCEGNLDAIALIKAETK